jgi:putative transposase
VGFRHVSPAAYRIPSCRLSRHIPWRKAFQGRFKAILVDRDAYLLEVCRYVELNPVRVNMVRSPDAWPWSSYRAHLGQSPTQQ